jgi:hypothetical protein
MPTDDAITTLATSREQAGARKQRLIAELMFQPTMVRAAKNAGVPLRTAQRWFRENAAFQADYHQARREMMDGAVKYLNANFATAVRLILNTITNEHADDRVRLAAAVKLLQLGFTGYEKMEIAARLEGIEARQARTGKLLDERPEGIQ